MKNIFKHISITAIVLSVACTKQIDLIPSDTIDPSKAFETVADLDAGLLGGYA